MQGIAGGRGQGRVWGAVGSNSSCLPSAGPGGAGIPQKGEGGGHCGMGTAPKAGTEAALPSVPAAGLAAGSLGWLRGDRTEGRG